MPQKSDALSRWTGNAPHWEKHRETLRGMFAPITAALIEETGIRAGDAVLDVATGSGEPALTIAEAVGFHGSVTGIDPVEDMIAASRTTAQRLGLTNVRFEVASGDALPVESESFDAAVCRFGVMFFPSPVAGVKEMLRALKPGRRLAFAVWHYARRNPFHSDLADAVDRYLQPEPVPPDSPDAFRFAPSGKLLEILSQAGATAPAERLLKCSIEVPLPPEDYWTFRMEWSVKLRKRVESLAPEKLNALRREVIENAERYSTPHGITFPAEVLIVSGDKQ